MERMLRIHQAIQSGRYPNATRLAKELEVSTKSIYRDLDFMRDRLKLPLAYNEDRWGYYYTQEVSSFPAVQMTEGELFAMLVAEKALQQYRGTSFEKPLLSAFEKIAAALPDIISLSLGHVDQTISFRTSAEPIVRLQIFDTLARAAARSHQLELLYRKPGQSQPERRTVDPYHLANINGEWFLFAYDHLRKDLRTFVPARIQEATFTGQSFKRPQNFSLEKTLRSSFGVRSGKESYNILLRFSKSAADFIREKRWHPSQRLRELRDGRLEMRLRLSNLAEIQRWLLGWGGQVVVLAPPELVDAVRASAQAILGNLGPQPSRDR
jgi:proteasome accessory factor B